MPKITLDEFCAHWVSGKWTTAMGSRLENNAFDFATVAGEYAKQQFQASFSSGGFCGGEKWAPRTSRWGRKFTHPVMNDTGALAAGIKGEAGGSISSGVGATIPVSSVKARITGYTRQSRACRKKANAVGRRTVTRTMRRYIIQTRNSVFTP